MESSTRCFIWMVAAGCMACGGDAFSSNEAQAGGSSGGEPSSGGESGAAGTDSSRVKPGSGGTSPGGDGGGSGAPASGGAADAGDGGMSSGGRPEEPCPDGCIALCEGGACSCHCDPLPTSSYECKQEQPAGASALGDPEKVAQVSGSNGTFVDRCDENGNLVEYVCETMLVCEGDINPACNSFETGQVISKDVDCVGTCENGVCAARCPDHGDLVTYLAVPDATTAVFVNETDQRRYQCDLIFGASGSCNTDARIGQTHTIQSLGLRGAPCTGTDFGNIGLEGCSYRCDISPP